MDKQFQVNEDCMRENISKYILKNMPSFLIIGAAKGGTTSLADNLNEHPKMECSNPKEPSFFTSKRYEKGVEHYSDLWTNTDDSILRFEASTLNVFVPCQERIQALNPDMKAILLLRDPVKRAWSNFWLFYAQEPKNHYIGMIMDEAHRCIRRGVYIEQIKRWHKFFPKKNLLIIKSEDYFNDETKILKQVYDFLDVEHILPEKISRRDPWADKKEMYGTPEMPPIIKEWLIKHYKPFNEKLEKYLNTTFEWSK